MEIHIHYVGAERLSSSEKPLVYWKLAALLWFIGNLNHFT